MTEEVKRLRDKKAGIWSLAQYPKLFVDTGDTIIGHGKVDQNYGRRLFAENVYCTGWDECFKHMSEMGGEFSPLDHLNVWSKIQNSYLGRSKSDIHRAGARWQHFQSQAIFAAKQTKLQSDLAMAVEALKFECGNRCAHQNPCNARETLEKLEGK